MCGRTACTLASNELSRASRYRDRAGQTHCPRWKDGDAEKYRPSYNKSPQSFSPVLLSNKHFNKESSVDECVLAAMRWGLIPAWFKEDDPSKMQYNTSNCRSESLLEKKSYKGAVDYLSSFGSEDPLLKGQRCVILADGFYEWRRKENEKQPFFIYFPQSHGGQVPSQHNGLAGKEKNENELDWTGWRPLTIAGLFDSWTPPSGGEALYTYTVITVDASPNLQGIHDRMPAVLDGEEEVRRWLDFGDVKSLEAVKLLQPKSSLTFHPVSSSVNNSRNNSPECLQPVDLSVKMSAPPSASSKVMMSWLKSASPAKRKSPGEDAAKAPERVGETRKTNKPTGSLQQWLLGSASKKPKTS